jgi:hypothetical protein
VGWLTLRPSVKTLVEVVCEEPAVDQGGDVALDESRQVER